jgi:hypothetical protein
MGEPNITIHRELIQSTDSWLAARCGLLTASVVKNIVTPGRLQYAKNDKARAFVYEIAAQKVTGRVESIPCNYAMRRGNIDEPYARDMYSKHFAPATELGFITRKWSNGVTIGYSPDGLVGNNGLIEIKSRAPKAQLQAIALDEVPKDVMPQLQTGLLVTEREWIDYISFAEQMPLYVKRVYPDYEMQTAIINAAEQFYEQVDELCAQFNKNAAGSPIAPAVDYDADEDIEL